MTATSNVLDALKPFCADREMRYEMRTPWYHDGFTYGSNAFVVCRIAGEHVTPDTENRPPAQDLPEWKSFGTASFVPGPPSPVAEEFECKDCHGTGKNCECPECDGEGEVQWYGDYSRALYSDDCEFCNGNGTISIAKAKEIKRESSATECESCDGKGKQIDTSGKTEVCGLHVRNDQLAIICSLPNVEVAKTGDGDKAKLLFRSGDFHGFVVPVI